MLTTTLCDYARLEVWFITGSQDLYGEEVLARVADDSGQIVDGLNASGALPVGVVFKPVLTTPAAISMTLAEADASPNCIGLVTWMHTFSPAKMWIAGLTRLHKPFCHLHTQFHRDIPWASIDMDYMNQHQSAHGGREFGFICSRLRRNRKVVVGHWQEAGVRSSLAVWMRAAAAWHDAQGMRIARIGDNMRQVAVTEGDKVEAERVLGYTVDGFGVGDVLQFIDAVADKDIATLSAEYEETYAMDAALRPGGGRHQSVREAARIELGLRAFLEDGGFKAYTDTFENLHGLRQLPGIASQRLMASGYGFGAEGDWKHAALVRSMKVMASGLPGGTSFMEDYTYHLDPSGQRVLGAHMLEICPSLAASRPRCDVLPLGIGGKEDPVRLIFDCATGPALNASLVDMGNRFRLVLNAVDVVPATHDLPKLPVARALWVPQPDLATAAAAWIYAGGAHHTGFSAALTSEHLQDYADMAGIECLHIDAETTLRQFRNELRWNDVSYHLAGLMG